MKTLFSVFLLLVMSGCAPMIWDKSGADQADFNRESYSCEKDARQSGHYGDGLAGAVSMQQFYNRCMVAQGYTLRRN